MKTEVRSSSVRTNAIGHGLLHARRATGHRGTESGGSLDWTESVSRWPRARRRTYGGGMPESLSRTAEERCVHLLPYIFHTVGIK